MKYSMKKGLVFLGVTFSSLVFANTSVPTVFASELSYSVETVIPDNQIDKKQSYFDLKMTPNQKQELVVHLRNDTDKAVEVTPTVSPATTNLNGVVEYGPSQTQLNTTAPYNIKSLIKSETDKIDIPAHSITDYKLMVTMPEKYYDGVLAGGIYFEEKDQNKDNPKQSKGLSIENRFSYVVAVLLQERDKGVVPELKLQSVTPSQVNSRNVINSDLENTQAIYINQLKVETEVRVKGKKAILYKSMKDKMQVAPNSTLSYPTALNGKKLEPGTYTIHVLATSGKYKWEFNKDFTITGEKAKSLNKKDVTIKEDHSWIYILLGFLFLIIALGMLFIIFWKKNQKKNEELEALKTQVRGLSDKNKEQ